MPGWIESLKKRWNLPSAWHVIIILVVFACTGTTVLLIKGPLFAYWFEDGVRPWWASVTYYILILPAYNVLLLGYGFVFGQFKFFWNFEKRFFSRMLSRFKSNKDSD